MPSDEPTTRELLRLWPTRGRSTVRRLHGNGWAERTGGLREGKAGCANRPGQRDRRRQPVCLEATDSPRRGSDAAEHVAVRDGAQSRRGVQFHRPGARLNIALDNGRHSAQEGTSFAESRLGFLGWSAKRPKNLSKNLSIAVRVRSDRWLLGASSPAPVAMPCLATIRAPSAMVASSLGCFSSAPARWRWNSRWWGRCFFTSPWRSSRSGSI